MHMTKRIRRVFDLPDWFDLAKYSKAHSLDAAGWYEQLHVRRELRSWVIVRKSYPEFGNEEDGRDPLSELLPLLRANPVVDVTAHSRLQAYFFSGALSELKTQELLYSPGVYPITLDNLYRMEYWIEKEKRDYARKFYNLCYEKGFPPLNPPKDWMVEPIDTFTNDDRTANIRVNLLVSEKQLIEGFKQLLKSLRAKKDPTFSIRKHARPNFSDWVRFGILPYLDLKIWEHEVATKIPNRVLADAVFLPGEGGEEMIRKTTAKLAVQLLGYSYMESLRALAAYEIAERKKI